MHCPSCNHQFGFLYSFRILNPLKYKCPSCGVVLTSGHYGKITNAIGILLLFCIMGIAMYMEQKTQDSILWLVIASLVFGVPYRWLIWRQTQFIPLAAISDTSDSTKTPTTWLLPRFLDGAIVIIFIVMMMAAMVGAEKVLFGAVVLFLVCVVVRYVANRSSRSK